jgi:hypothetical protein
MPMNTHYLLGEAHEHATAAAAIIRELQDGPEKIDRDRLNVAAQRLRQALELLNDETVDFEIGETDD